MHFFRGSFIVMFLGILLGGAVGYMYGNSVEAALKAMFICAILTVLEVSISFDNAVVNAGVLKDMTPLWQRRFLTWGMLIAVFGMRLIFYEGAMVSISFHPPTPGTSEALFAERYNSGGPFVFRFKDGSEYQLDKLQPDL